MFSSFLGRVSRDYFICLSVIINYDFDLSVFIFPKSGLKITENVQLRNPIKSQIKVLKNLVTKANLVGFLFYLTMVREHDGIIST